MRFQAARAVHRERPGNRFARPADAVWSGGFRQTITMRWAAVPLSPETGTMNPLIRERNLREQGSRRDEQRTRFQPLLSVLLRRAAGRRGRAGRPPSARISGRVNRCRLSPAGCVPSRIAARIGGARKASCRCRRRQPSENPSPRARLRTVHKGHERQRSRTPPRARGCGCHGRRGSRAASGWRGQARGRERHRAAEHARRSRRDCRCRGAGGH